MNYETSKILVRNTSNLPLCIPCRYKLGHFLDMAYKNCFLINTQSAYNVASIPLSLHPISNLSARSTLPLIDALMETVFENGIRVFEDADAVRQISDLVAKYPSI